ncbi:MAG: hydroxyacid dehydrogenase [Haloarculaceae archaeon]
MDILVTIPEGELRETFFPDRLRERLESLGTVAWNDSTENLDEPGLREQVPGVDVLVTGWGSPRVTADVLAAADDLELVAHTGGSVADYVSEAVYDAGISVVSANDVMAEFTAEHALALILSDLRAVPDLDRGMGFGEWAGDDTAVRTLFGRDVGLVGLGTVGRTLLDLLEPFDAAVSVYDPYVDPPDLADAPHAELADLDAALDSSVVSVHAARTEETVGMIDADRLARVPDGALFVNTARAEVVEEEALFEAVAAGRIRCALDVYHEEPLAPDDEWRQLDGALLTPHVGGSQIRPPLTEAVLDGIERFQHGDPLEGEIPREQWATMTR